MVREGNDIPPTGNLTQGAMPATPTLLLHTALGDDGGTPALIAVDKATGERVGSLEVLGLGMYGMILGPPRGTPADCGPDLRRARCAVSLP